MYERIELLKEQFDYGVGEIGTIIPYKKPKLEEAKDDIHAKGWINIKMDRGGGIAGAFTEGEDYKIIKMLLELTVEGLRNIKGEASRCKAAVENKMWIRAYERLEDAAKFLELLMDRSIEK